MLFARALDYWETIWKFPKLSCIRVGKTRFFYNKNHDQVVRDYYLYTVELLSEAAAGIDLHADIVVGNYRVRGANREHYRKLDFQIEHTLVKPGGRGSAGAPSGCIPIPSMPGINYLVRIQDLDRLASADGLIEYSKPNFINIKTSRIHSEVVEKTCLVAPLVFPLGANFSDTGRDLEVITLFGNTEEPRRKSLLEKLKQANSNSQNISGHFGDVRSIYRRTKILVNVRQTDHHDTLEELRVLPALQSGVIVISEDVPLRNEIPYSEFIIWGALEDIPSLVESVHENYDKYFNSIFKNEKLHKCFKRISIENKENAVDLLRSMKNS